MMIPVIILVTSFILLWYYSYKSLWFHVVSVFESLQTKGGRSSEHKTIQSSHGYLFLPKRLWELDIDQDQWITSLKVAARFSFSFTIAGAILIIEFILIRVLFEKEASVINSYEYLIWETVLLSLIGNLEFIQPFIITFLIINKFFKSKHLNRLSTKLGASCSIVAVWLLFASKFDRFTDFQSINFEDMGLSSRLLYKMSIIGITLIAILNGIGSFSTAYYYLYRPFMVKDELLNTDEETLKQKIMDLNKTYSNTENLISSKQLERESQSDHNQGNLQKRSNTYSKSSFIDIKSYFQTGNYDSSDDALQSEIRSLTLIKNDLFLKIEKYQTHLESLSSQKSDHHQIIDLVKKVLAVYCLLKITQVTLVKVISVLRYYNNKDALNTSESDPLVITISKIIQIFITVRDEEFLINQLSFIVSGALFICSFNGVFVTLTHLYKFIPIDLSDISPSSSSNKNPKSVSIIKNLLVSELLGIYVLATTFILRSNLTKSFSAKLNFLLDLNDQSHGFHDFHVIDDWFDKVFLLSVVVTASVIKISEILTVDEGFESHELLNKVV